MINKERIFRDYADRIKELISTIYEPGTPDDHDAKLTTQNIFHDLCNIIPETAFDVYDVVDALEELNFTPGYERKVEKGTDDHGNEVTVEYEDLKYFWYLKRKNSPKADR